MPLQSVAQAEDADRPDETGPMRRCAVTRQVLPKAALIRFVASPEGEIVPDLKERLPGRGVWVGAAEDLVAEAVRHKVFARALKAQIGVPPDLAQRVGQMLDGLALQALSLANKAGAVTFGFAKVDAALKRGQVLALIHARDASDDGCGKLDAKYRSITGNAAVPPIRIFTADELSLASGRTNVIHAALTRGGAAANVIAAADRAQRFHQASGAF